MELLLVQGLDRQANRVADLYFDWRKSFRSDTLSVRVLEGEEVEAFQTPY